MEFNALRAKFAKAGTEILGVSPDSVASHDKFKKKYDLAFPLVSDEEKDMLSAYGVWVEKSMYGRKYMGVERTTFLIDAKGVIRHKYVGAIDERVWREELAPRYQALLDEVQP